MLEGLELLGAELGLTRDALLGQTELVVHGTTVATNALLERKGAVVGMLTTAGHRDVVEMREGLKDDRYNLRMPPPVPLVPRARRLDVRERIRFDGAVETPLDRRSVDAAARALGRDGVQSVAVCYLHAYRDGRHERETRRLLARLLPGAYVSLSSEVLPQIKEYERFGTTVVNAYVGPVLAGYLGRLEKRLGEAGYRGRVLIMQSHGGVATIADSVRLAAGAVLSGPAGGIAGSAHCARVLGGAGNLITFDMGGTSTDIALLEGGEPQLTGDKAVGGSKVALPSIDIHTLGAGGGSIARVDIGGILHVGAGERGRRAGPRLLRPRWRGGHRDRRQRGAGAAGPGQLPGGRTRLDAAAAETAVARVGRALGVSAVAAAEGICRVVNTNMAEGIRLVSVRRGADPRRFALFAFGGAAGLHITEVARMLEIGRVVIPQVASVLSAWGMLATDLRYEMVRTHVGEAREIGTARLRRRFSEMEAEGRKRLGGFAGDIAVRRSVDMRYGEQTFEISVPLDGVSMDAPDLMEQVVARFHARHEALYTYSAPGQEVVLVNARLAVIGRLPTLPREEARAAATAPVVPKQRRAYLGRWMDVPVHDMERLAPGQEIKGPAIFESATTTVVVRADERALVTREGWLDVTIG